MNSVIDVSLELNPVLEGLVRATLILVLACIGDALLRSKNPRWRVLLSRTTVLFLLALPCIVLFAPTWDLHILPRAGLEMPGSGNEPVMAAPPGSILTAPTGTHTKDAMPTAGVLSEATPFSRTLGALCVSVGLALILGSMLRYVMTIRRARRGEPAPQAIRVLSGRIAHDLGLSVEPEVFLDASTRVPYVFGCFRPVMVLPARMASETYAADLPGILTHELVHIRQRDTLWIPLLHVFKQALWFHPLAWRLQHAHAQACEAICDARAARYVGGAEQYGGCLARVALEVAGLRWREAMSVPMIRRSQVTRRLRDLGRGTGAASLTRGRVWTAILLASAVAFPLVNVNVVRAQDPSAPSDAAALELEDINTLFVEIPSTEPGAGLVELTNALLVDDTSDAADEAAEPKPDEIGYIEKILESPIGLEFTDIHLSEVLDFVLEKYELSIIVDNRVVPPHDWEGVPGEGNTYVTDGRIAYINLKNVKLGQALSALLRPLELTYSVQRSFIWISSPDNIAHESFEELETREYAMVEGTLPYSLGSSFEGEGLAESISENESVLMLKGSLRLGDYLFPEIRNPGNGEPIAWQRIDTRNRRLTIHYVPSVLDEFEAFIQKEGWAMERITK